METEYLPDIEDEETPDTRRRSRLVRCGEQWSEWEQLKPKDRPKVRPGCKDCARQFQHETNPNTRQHTKASPGWLGTEIIQ